MNTMDNRFFDSALRQASGIASRKSRLLGLAFRLFDRIRTVEWKNVRWESMRDKFYTLGRFSKAYALGHYRNVDVKTMVIIAAAILYFLNPIDLLPDLLPLGLTDDFAVLLWAYGAVEGEINKFLDWERDRVVITITD